MDSIVLKSKISPPKINQSWVSRPLLDKQLKDIFTETPSILLITAPPGYGKTTLAASRFSGSKSTVWLTIGKTDQFFSSFIRYLSSGFKQSFPLFGELISPVLATPIDRAPEYYTEIFAYEIEKLEKPVTLVIDNYHEIEDEKISVFMSELLDTIPLNLNIVIISQEDPPFAVSRRRLNQNIHEIREKDLAFGPDEINNLLKEGFSIFLPDEYLKKVEQKTEGWPAAISLVALSLSKIKADERLTAIDTSFNSYNYIIDYFTDSIIKDIDKPTMDFITDTVLLESFTPALSDYIRNRKDSDSVISGIKKKHLPVLLQENNHEWFRYHTLFSDYIKFRYRSPNQSEIFIRASQWFEQNNSMTSAIKYALLSGKSSLIESIVTRESENLFTNGKFEIISQILNNPDTRQLKNPSIIKTRLWADYLSGNFENPETFLNLINENLGSMNNHADELLCLKAWVLFRAGDSSCEEIAEESTRRMKEQRSFYSYMARLIYGKSLLLNGNPEKAAVILTAALKDIRTSSFIFIYYAVINNLLHALLSAGYADEALEKGTAALQYNNSNEIFIPEKSMVLIAIARIHLIRKEPEKAKEYAEKALSTLHLINIRDFIFEDGQELLNEINLHLGKEIPQTVRTYDPDGYPIEKLSRREKEIISLLAQGNSNQEISRILFISIGTVKWHLNNIFGKLNVKNRTQVILKAKQLNLI